MSPNLIRLSKSYLGSEEKEAVCRVIENGFLGMGLEVQNFEAELASYLGGDVSVACVNTGTSALQLALQAIGIGPGDEVLVPSLTYVASFQAISATGAKPVACDVELSPGFIDLADAEGRLTANTKAIMPVHFASYVVGMPAVYEFSKRYKLRVVEDAAHSFGCALHGNRIGSFGDVVCFSFDGIKNITSGEGGAVVSHDVDIIEKVKDSRLLGVVGDTEKRFSGGRSWTFDVREKGWRYHMSDLMAAIGRAQLRKCDSLFQRRKTIVSLYAEGLKEIPRVDQYDFSISTNNVDIVPHIYPIKVPDPDALIDFLSTRAIQCGKHYQPNHLLSFYEIGTSLPNAEFLSSRNVSLPLHPGVSNEEVKYIIESIREYYN